MKTLLAYVLLPIAVASGVLSAQTPGGSSVIRLDPGLDGLVTSDAKLELLKGDYFGFLEGPVWVREGQSGYLLFNDIPANVIYKWTPDGVLSVFLERSGFTGTDISNVGAVVNNGRLTVVLIGSSALALDREGRLVIVAMADRKIVRLEKDGTRTTLADRYEGKRLNSPNDLVIKSNGALYFTDGTGGLRYRDDDPTKELPFHGVFLLKNGRLQLLARDPLGLSPNGIALSPDETSLYVCSPGARKIVRFDVQPDDTVTNARLLVDMSGDKTPGGPDGMKVDQRGNIYATGPRGVWIISPDGRHLGTILTPENATNLAFGDVDGKTLYIVGHRNLYRIRLNASGIRQ